MAKIKIIAEHKIYAQKFFLKLGLCIFLGIFFMTILSLSPSVSAIQECDDKYPNVGGNQGRLVNDERERQRQACNNGYDRKKANPQQSPSQICGSSPEKEACEAGVSFANTVSQTTIIERDAANKCTEALKDVARSGAKDDMHEACKKAYVEAKNNPNKSKSDICGSKSGSEKEGCEAGADLAKRGYTEAQRPSAESAANAYCSDKYRDLAKSGEKTRKINACIKSYLDGLNTDKTKAEACRGKTGDAKKECEEAFEKGRKDKNDGFVKQGSDGETEDDAATDCDITLTNPLSWIICPLIDLGANTTDYVFKEVAKPLLEDIPISTDRSDPMYSVWQGFRFIANIIVIGSMLAIVYAQARGER